MHLGRLKKLVFDTPYQDYFSGNKYVFHHLHKCGGTSLKKSLEDYFILKKDYGVSGESPLEFKKLSSFDLLVGHFEMEYSQLFKRYPEVEESDVFLFTMVREPLQMMISLYYYWMNHGKIKDIGLQEFLDSKENYLAQLLFCTEDNWKNVLSKYSYIGVLESYEKSIEILSVLTNRKFKIYNIENRSTKDDQKKAILADEQFVRSYQQRNALDFKIYHQVVENFKHLESIYLR